MKLWELAPGLLTPLNNEEDELLNKLLVDDSVALTEREEMVAQVLTQKGALIREETEDTYIFKVNHRVDTWRD